MNAGVNTVQSCVFEILSTLAVLCWLWLAAGCVDAFYWHPISLSKGAPFIELGFLALLPAFFSAIVLTAAGRAGEKPGNRMHRLLMIAGLVVAIGFFFIHYLRLV